MLTLDGTAQAAVDSAARGVATLVQLDFSTGTLYVTDWPTDITVGGNTYSAVGSLMQIEGMSESEDRAARDIVLAFTAVNSAMIAASIGPANVYRRKAVRIYQQFMDSLYVPAGTKVQRWSGYMDQVNIERNATDKLPGGGESQGKINLKCTRAGVAMARRALGLRSTHAQQIALYPTDKGLEYQQTLIESPSLWLSKKFQEV
jgi:hypothetical protein